MEKRPRLRKLGKRLAGGARWFARAARAYGIENRRSILGFLVILGLAIAFILGLAFLKIIDLSFIWVMWPTGYGPLRTTLILTVASFVIGFVGALGLGLVRAYGPGILRKRSRDSAHPGRAVAGKAGVGAAYGIGSGYVSAIRGTPFLIQMYFVLYVIFAVAPNLAFLGASLYFWAGLMALSLNTFGYQAEVLRAGFQSVPQGQIEAARSIGLRRRQVFAHVTLPQSVRLIVLPLTNEFISLLKASTIVGYIPVVEIFKWSEDMGVHFGHPIEGFVMISMFYLLINVPLSRTVSYIERKKRIPGLGTPLREEGREARPTVRPRGSAY